MHAATGAPHSQLTAEYALLNKQVLSQVLNESIELAARRAAGRLFQHLGPAAEKGRSPNRVFICLTRRSHLSVDRSRRPEADECVSLQYSRADTQARPHEATCRPVSRSQTRSKEELGASVEHHGEAV